jgi:hypothetical protein
VRVVADLNHPQPERFAVLEVHLDQRDGDGCRATVLSLHMDRAEAERAARTSSNNSSEGTAA